MDEDIIILPTAKVKKGLIIAKDILSTSGELLVAKHTEFSTPVKTKLFAFGIMEVPIFNDGLLQKKQPKQSAPKKLKIDFADVKSSIPAETMDTVLYQQNIIPNNIDVSTIDVTAIPKAKAYTQFPSNILPRTLAIKENSAFKHYCSLYNESLNEYKTEIRNMVLKNIALNIPKILVAPLQIVEQHDNDFGVLEMLYNMRTSYDPIFCHSYNTALVSGVLAKLIHMSDDDIQLLIISALLHDIGKLFLPVNILYKPNSLTKEEYDIITTHPILGYNVIKNQSLDPRIKACVLMHHEKCDGSGYPAQLSSERLPEFVKILTIADVYDAMSSKRSYRDAFCPFEIIKTFEDEGFQKYEPKILLPFLRHLATTYVNCKVLLSDGRIGIIIMINENILSRPLLFVKNEYIDLSKDYSLSIIEII